MTAPVPHAADTADPLLADLTAPQREAVTHVQGPLLVLAGAGSGKTRVITRRIAYLVLRVGIPPWNVLAITFTNKAAGEMKERVAKLVSERQARAITVCTFHSLCARVIRQYADRLGLPPGYSIYDSADQQRAVKQALETLAISSTNFPPGRVLGTISSAKNELISEDAYAKTAHDFYAKTVARIYRKYQEILKQNRALDFDDLLFKTVKVMREHADVLAALREHYQYLLIDEYQDTNHAQFLIASALAGASPTGGPGGKAGLHTADVSVEDKGASGSISGGGQNICATGDPDQSIYGWRGANIRNILDFEHHYPSAAVVRLEQNYRSTKNILAVADQLIQNNRQRKHKTLWTENDAGEKVRVAAVRDEHHEADWVCQQFRAAHEERQVPWGDMAVFYRINSLSRVMEDTLRTASVPYQIARGTAFYERKEIKDAVAYLRLIVNPADEVNLSRVINTPARGISDASVDALQAHAAAQQATLLEAMDACPAIAALNSRAVAAVLKFAKLIRAWREQAGLLPTPSGAEATTRKSLHAFVEHVLRDSGLHAYYAKDPTDPDQERLANLGELVSSAQQFESELEAEADANAPRLTLADKLIAWLEQISLVSDVDGLASEQGAVTLMTLHAAKGLEFPLVAMIGVEDGLLPHSQSSASADKVEEERRLCFVGFTRAKRHLLVSHARYRTIFGKTTPTIPSRFLNELPEDHVEAEDLSREEGWVGGGFGARREGAAGGRRLAPELAEFAPGTLVRHEHFGLGKVTSITATGAHTRVQVAFPTVGVKTLILEYANLEKVVR